MQHKATVKHTANRTYGTVKRVLEQVNAGMRRKATGRLAPPGDRVAGADTQGLIV